MLTILEKIKNIPRIDYINYLILLYALTISFPSEIKRVVAILMIILWLTDRTKYDFKLPKTNIFLLFGIFIVYSSLSYFWSDVSLKEAFDYIKRYWYYLPIFIIFKYLKKEYFEYAISSFFLGMLISEILSYGNFFNLWQVGIGNSDNPRVFLHHTMYSMLLSVTSIFLLFRIIDSKETKLKVFYILFFITVNINLLFNSGRTGYFALVITIFLMILIKYRINFKIILSTIILISFIFITFYTYSEHFKNRINFIKSDISSLVEEKNYNTSLGARFGFWIIAEEITKDSSFFGIGIANHIKQRDLYIKEHNLEKEFKHVSELKHFHNTYLEIYTQLGLVGLVFFALMIISLLKIKIQNNMINNLKISTILLFLIGGLVDNLFHLNYTITLFCFIMGICLAQYKFEFQTIIQR